MNLMRIQLDFDNFADAALRAASTRYAFGIAAGLVAVWFFFGFWIGFTNTFYELLINTGTTIITFLIGFLILHAQHKEAMAEHAQRLQEHREILDAIHANTTGEPNEPVTGRA